MEISQLATSISRRVTDFIRSRRSSSGSRLARSTTRSVSCRSIASFLPLASIAVRHLPHPLSPWQNSHSESQSHIPFFLRSSSTFSSHANSNQEISRMTRARALAPSSLAANFIINTDRAGGCTGRFRITTSTKETYKLNYLRCRNK